MADPHSTSATCLDDSDPGAISIEQARERIATMLTPIGDVETVALNAAMGRVAAQSVMAPIDIPPFRSSAMDGYALRRDDEGDRRTVHATSLAGHPGPDELPSGACQHITTGARVPDQADTVVMQENVIREGDSISVRQWPELGTHVRHAGSDIRAGSTLIQHGDQLGAASLGMLAASGIACVSVYRPVRVAILSTGDELAAPEQSLTRGMIHDANSVLLQGLLNSPRVELIDLGVSADSTDALQAALSMASHADVIVSSGGVSVGEADFVKDVLASRGSLHLWKVAMKPGRPLSFGLLDEGIAWFGLPGNPVSAALTCLMFVRSALAQLTHMQPPALPCIRAQLDSPLSKRPGRVEFQRCVLQQHAEGHWHASTTGLQDSHVLSSLQQANALVRLPTASQGAQAGEWVDVIPFTAFAEAIV